MRFVLASVIVWLGLSDLVETSQASTSVPGADAPTFQLNASAIYDSNVARSNAATAALRGIVPEDVAYWPNATVNLVKDFGIESFYLRGVFGYEFYQRNAILNREMINSEAGAEVRILQCDTTVTPDYSRRQSDLSDVIAPVAKNTSTIRSITLGSKCGHSEGFVPYFLLSDTLSDNSSSLLVTSNYRSAIAEAGISYVKPSLGEITLFGEYDKTDFPDRLLPQGLMLESDSYDFSSGGLRYKHNFGARIQAFVSVSYVSLIPRLTYEPGFQGFNYEADVTAQPLSRLNLTLSFLRDLKPSVQLNSTYSVQQTFGVSAEYILGTKWKSNLSADHSEQSYQGAALAIGGAALVDGIAFSSETINDVSGSLTRNLSHNLSLTLSATEESRRANITDFNYNDTRVELAVASAF